MNQKEIDEISEILEIKFKNKELIQRAFTHRSYINEHKSYSLGHNERLEYLGDAVLELLITEELFFKFPDKDEGILTSIRSAVVKTNTLAEKARELGYGKYLRMSNGEEATGGRDREYILANTFEAVLGAIYLDRGYKQCKNYLAKILFPIIPDIIKNKEYIDSKSKLQEIAQEKLKSTPRYELMKQTGPDHNKLFTMAVYIRNKKYTQAEGRNKQEAEQNAAAKVLELGI